MGNVHDMRNSYNNTPLTGMNSVNDYMIPPTARVNLYGDNGIDGAIRNLRPTGFNQLHSKGGNLGLISNSGDTMVGA